MKIKLKNGVIVPDIPDEILENYPNICITSIPSEGYYEFLASKEAILFSPESVSAYLGLTGNCIGTVGAHCCGYLVSDFNGETWEIMGGGTGLGYLGIGSDTSIVWSRDDIYELESVDVSTGSFNVSGLYFLSSVPNISQIPEVSNDIVSQYPYWIITNAYNELYMLMVSNKPFGYISEQLASTLGYPYAMIGSMGTGNRYLVQRDSDSLEWIKQNNEEMTTVASPEGVNVDSAYYVIVSNHDVKVIESIDESMNATWSDEVYFEASIYTSNYVVPCSWLKSLASQARRISGEERKFNRDEMLEVFKSVESGAKTKIIKIVPWSTGTDEQIAAMVSALDAGEISIEDTGWSIGDERKVTLSAMAATGVKESHAEQTATLVLMDSQHYTLTEATTGGDTKDHFVVGMKNCLNEKGYINSTNTNIGSWSGCARRAWCNNVFRAAIPETIRGCFKQFKVSTATENNSDAITETDDYFALFAEKEVCGNGLYSTSAEKAALAHIQWYETVENRKKTVAGATTPWCLRSPKNGNTTSFAYIWTDGTWGSEYANQEFGISPFGCI